MLIITPTLALDESEITFKFIRSPGPGGQNVNKVATTVLLRFDVYASPALSNTFKHRLKMLAGTKLTAGGILSIKASSFRTQERNKQDALDRLLELLKQAAVIPKKRRKTKPTKSSVEKRLSKKKITSKTKSSRSKKSFLD
jgi:ribosome-associated protein